MTNNGKLLDMQKKKQMTNCKKKQNVQSIVNF